MKTAFNKLLIAAKFFLPILVLTLSSAPEGLAFRYLQSFSPPEPPVKMRLTGVFHPYEAKDEIIGLYAFPVSVQDKRWIFQTEEARTLTGSSLASSVLSHLFPPRLRLVGPKELIEGLQEPEIEGKRLTVTGYLYIPSNRLRVTEVDEVSGDGE